MNPRAFWTILLAALLAAGFAGWAAAQGSGTDAIAFPVQELGNCGSKADCKAFCDKSENMKACVAFAEKRGMMNKEEAARARRFSDQIESQAGPGGCGSPRECLDFCNSIRNAEACAVFAEEHGAPAADIAHVKKLAQFLKTGGRTPGGCDTKQACEAYCRDFSHAEECSRFVTELTGVAPVDKRFAELAQKGEMPGGCRSKQECEAYCHDQSHRDECVAFAERAGLIHPEEAAKIRQSGFMGPGDCKSQETCRDYCNDPANRDVCIKYAEEHGLMKPEEVRRVKESMVHIRSGLERAPAGTKACLESAVGTEIVENIQAGNLVPGPEIGERVRECLDRFQVRPDLHRPFADAPPEVKRCLQGKFGDALDRVIKGQAAPTPEMADAVRACAMEIRLLEEPPRSESAEEQAPTPVPSRAEFERYLKQAPEEVRVCAKGRLGEDFEPSPEAKDSLRRCFEEFKPQTRVWNVGDVPDAPRTAPAPVRPSGSAPADAVRTAPVNPMLRCAEQIFGAERARNLAQGHRPSPEEELSIKNCMARMNTQPIRPPVPQGVVPNLFRQLPGGDIDIFTPKPVPDPAAGTGAIDGARIAPPPAYSQSTYEAPVLNTTYSQSGYEAPTVNTVAPPAYAQGLYQTYYQATYESGYDSGSTLPPPPLPPPTTYNRYPPRNSFGSVVGSMLSVFLPISGR